MNITQFFNNPKLNINNVEHRTASWEHCCVLILTVNLKPTMLSDLAISYHFFLIYNFICKISKLRCGTAFSRLSSKIHFIIVFRSL